MSLDFAELQRWIAPLGWALLHFAWQGMAVALVAWALMTLARGPRARYGIGCAGLAAMLALPIATLAWIGPDARPAPAPPVTFIARAAPDVVDLGPADARPPLVSPQAPAASPTLHDRLAPHAPTLVAIWLIGVAIGATYHLVGFAQLARLRRRAVPLVDAAWQERVARLSARLGLRRAVRLCVTSRLDGPAVAGAFRPVVLWPAAALTGLTPTQIEALLAHEIAHVCRHDYVVNLLQTLVETLLFYHPGMWWLSRRVRQEREHCCDDLAAGIVGDRATYAGALVAMESLRAMPPLALAASGGTLLTRVRRLVTPATSTRRWSPAGLGLIVTTFVLAGLFACKPREQSAAAATQAATMPAATSATQPAAPIDFAALAAHEPFFARLVGAREELVAQLAQVEGTQGRASPPAVKLRAQLDVLNVRLDATAAQLSAAAATRAAYDDRIAAGQLLRVTVADLYKSGEEAVIVKRVAADGTITLPYFKFPFELKGLTIFEAERRIADAYRNAAMFSEPPNVGVLVVQSADGQPLVPAGLFAPVPIGTVVAPAAPPQATAPPRDRSIILRGDLVRVTIADLAGPGTPTVEFKNVSAGGTISLPYLKSVTVADLSTDAAEQAISRKYAEAQVMTDAAVSLLVVQDAEGRPLVPAGLLGAAPTADATAARAEAERAELKQEIAELRKRLDAKSIATTRAAAIEGNEYYLGGRVQRTGVYSLGGRAISLKQALISGGMLDPVLVDERSTAYRPKAPVRIEILRRDGNGGESRITRDFAKLFDGSETDVPLQPNDQILVGTLDPAEAAPAR